MLLSMTGYGRATQTHGHKTITIEIRALNSKMTDLRMKMPPAYRQKEADLRKIVMNNIDRGKIEINIDIASIGGDDEFGLNRPLFTKYYQELSALANELDADKGELMSAIVRIPNVITEQTSDIKEEEWTALENVLKDAIVAFSNYRATEGKSLYTELDKRITNINQLLTEVEVDETARIDKIRTRLKQNLEEYLGKENVDENRFEQEIIFYLEKMDITEEKVRLEQHCKYFAEVMNDNNMAAKGRKLAFISQEIGREINTLGAKAYSSIIQRIVVNMKDELEKIKEQVANLV